jgi:hypothetical protein
MRKFSDIDWEYKEFYLFHTFKEKQIQDLLIGIVENLQNLNDEDIKLLEKLSKKSYYESANT